MKATHREATASDLVKLFVVEESISGKDSLSHFVDRFLKAASDWFQADGASVFLQGKSPGSFQIFGQAGALSEIPPGTTLQSGVGLAGKAILDGRPTLVQGETNGSSKRRIASSMIVPLVDPRGRCVGVLNVARCQGRAQFEGNDLETAEALAQHLALAVTNATMFHESRHLNDMLKVVLGSLGFGLISMNQEGAITHYNPEIVVLLGRVPGSEEPLSQFIFRCGSELAEPIVRAASDGLAGNRARVRHQANQRVYSISATPLASKGVTIAIQDVTDLENAQREHDRLKRLAEVGQMTATIAHEIRNPLTGIRSAAKMITENPELADEFASIIEVESIKLARLCDEFLEFARPLRLELQDGTLGPLVAHVARTLEADFKAANVRLTLNICDTEPTIQLDARRMEQVIRNLMLNALQATKSGGEVKGIVTPMCVVIQDTGSGMDEETVNRLFSPFFTTKPQGTGLGLSMVRKVVDAHQASIEIQSKPGVGTQFTIRMNQDPNR